MRLPESEQGGERDGDADDDERHEDRPPVAEGEDRGDETRCDERPGAEDDRDRRSCSLASRPSKRSRMMARGRMPTAPAPTPWTRRKPSSAVIEGASAQPSPQRTKSASPVSMSGLRPYRSASGPTASGAVENPAMKIAMTAAVSAGLAPNCASIVGRLGSDASMASGGSTESAPRDSVSLRPGNDISPRAASRRRRIATLVDSVGTLAPSCSP